MSLNITPGYPMNPMWTRTWHSPASPPILNPQYPPPTHYNHSRPASPTQSVKSRKSYLSKASRRNKYADSDEDFDDKRSTRSGRPKKELGRHRKISTESSSFTRESSDEAPYRSDSVRESEDLVEESSQAGEEDNTQKRPATPLGKWECEHCTFVNEPLKKVCIICCKTPSAKVKLVPETKTHKRTRGTLQKSKSSDDYKDCSETESVLNKFERQLSLLENAAKNKENRKGRASRKISFWPGTKFPTVKH